jgi:hypothetical protein|tara:strand:- start:1500 stop:1889 length:390 start_codon:yes stop_codon:yes gene_type:complete
MAYKPDSPNKYAGNQVVINSDRLLFNAKKDAILIIGNETVGISTNGTFNVDSGSETIINSPEIYLGLGAEEPIVLGDTLLGLLEELCDALAAETHPTPVGPSGPPINASQYSAIKGRLKEFLSPQNKTL